MKKILLSCIPALVVLGTSQASAQTLLLENFESYTTPLTNQVLFRQPSFSGSTSAKLDATPNEGVVRTVGGFPLGDPNNVLHVAFNFKDSGAEPLWLRLTTFNAPILPNPTVGLWPGWGLQFDIYPSVPLYVTALIRETEANAPLGGNGGSSGTIEFVGGNPTQTSGRGKEVPANAWTTLVFDFGSDPVFGFTGNGVLQGGTDGKGVLEALGLATDPGNTAPINVWLDNFQLIPEPSTVALTVLGGLAMAVWGARRRTA
ncbi:MAG TPA: PEP-CTERM sorting domain-containing protein [Verrucomicrobiae bacterium]